MQTQACGGGGGGGGGGGCGGGDSGGGRGGGDGGGGAGGGVQGMDQQKTPKKSLKKPKSSSTLTTQTKTYNIDNRKSTNSQQIYPPELVYLSLDLST